jgi:hypothetical protein
MNNLPGSRRVSGERGARVAFENQSSQQIMDIDYQYLRQNQANEIGFLG